MFVKERQKYIVDMVNLNGSVRVKELGKRFSVTEDCIRKDLATLEKQGLLKRAYGGAVTIRENSHTPRSADRKLISNTDERKQIADKAIALLKDNDVIFLDVSLTNVEIAKKLVLAPIKLTVLTNMIDIINILVDAQNVSLIALGGNLNNERDAFWGSMTREMLKLFRVDYAFLGTVGVNPYDGSISTYAVEDGYTKQTVLSITKNSYLLCEKNKFTADGSFVYATLSDISGIIVGGEIPKNVRKALKEFIQNIS